MITDWVLIEPTTITVEEFKALVDATFYTSARQPRVAALIRALWFLLNCTGERGAVAFRAHCRSVAERDAAELANLPLLVNRVSPGGTDPDSR